MKKARKVLVFLMVLTFTLSVSLSAFAAPDKSHSSKGKGKSHSSAATAVAEEQPAADTTVVAPWVFKANKNLIQFRSPDETGGKIVIPIVALRNHLGVLPHDSEAVKYDQLAGTITIILDGKTLFISPAGINLSLNLTDKVVLDKVDPIVLADSAATTFDVPFNGTLSGTTAFSGTVVGSFNTETTDDLEDITGAWSVVVDDGTIDGITLSGTLGGTLAAPTIALDSDINAQTTSSFADLTAGQTIVPFDQLSELLGLGANEETAADSIALTDESADEDEVSAVDETPAE